MPASKKHPPKIDKNTHKLVPRTMIGNHQTYQAAIDLKE
jgi:hypothetical protein